MLISAATCARASSALCCKVLYAIGARRGVEYLDHMEAPIRRVREGGVMVSIGADAHNIAVELPESARRNDINDKTR